MATNANDIYIANRTEIVGKIVHIAKPCASQCSSRWPLTRYHPTYLQYRLIPSGRGRSRSTSRVRIASVSKRHESEYHLQESMGTVVASSSHIVPTIRWKALPQILEAAQAKSTRRNEKERERNKEGEGERKRGRECDRARGRGHGGLDRLIYPLSDQPTYLPTNLPPSNVDAYHVAKRVRERVWQRRSPSRAKHISCSPKGD